VRTECNRRDLRPRHGWLRREGANWIKLGRSQPQEDGPTEGMMLQEQIRSEIQTPFYQQNFSNDGTRFIAWYLRRVLRRDQVATKDDITDGQNDKQIDAIVIDDDERCVKIVQGKFLDGTSMDGEPLREILSAWARINDLPSLQQDCNENLRKR
jgi:hypothetical protein